MRETQVKSKQPSKENWKTKQKSKLKKSNGITLISLVVTIVVMLILAGITIQTAIGDGELIDLANQSKDQQLIQTYKDRIGIVGTTWSLNRALDESVTVDDLWQNMQDAGIIEDKERDVEKVDENGNYIITVPEGYKFQIHINEYDDVEVEYIGKDNNLLPYISAITVVRQTTNSVELQVSVSRLNGGTLSYYYKQKDEPDENYQLVKGDTTDITASITGLTDKTTYEIKVEATNGNGRAEKIIEVVTGELREGSITQVGETIWSTGTATIELETTEEGVTIQYQIDGMEGQWIDYEGPITGLNHGETVFAVITDGTNQSGHTTINILDQEAPTVTVTQGSVTTNSIQVSVNSSDAEWGMLDSITYNYYIKQTSAGSYPIQATHTGTETSYTFTGLTQGTSYDIKVTTQDKAGNEGEGQVTNITTNTVGGASQDLKEGNIVASDPTWSNGTASITLSKGTGVASNLTIQYQVGATTGNWTTGTEGANSVTITGLSHNSVVYARLTDGNNVGSYASVTILDLTPPSTPTVNTNGYVSDTWTNTNVTLSFSSSDNESGLLKYQWSPDGINIQDITNPYTWTTDTRTGFYVRAVDNAGNYSSWSEGIIIAKDTTPPVISNYWYSEVNGDTVSLYVQASDNLSGLNRVLCPTSTAVGEYNDWIWLSTVWDASVNAYRADIKASDFNKYETYYRTHIYAYDNVENYVGVALNGQEKYLTNPVDLYNAGEINTALVGGFTRQRSSLMITSGWSGSGSYSMADSYIAMSIPASYSGSGSNGNRAEGFTSNYMVNLTNYSYLKFVVDFSMEPSNTDGGTRGLILGVFDGIYQGFVDHRVAQNMMVFDSNGGSTTRATIAVDIRGLSGSYYIGAAIVADRVVYDTVLDCKIHRIYLEK